MQEAVISTQLRARGELCLVQMAYFGCRLLALHQLILMRFLQARHPWCISQGMVTVLLLLVSTNDTIFSFIKYVLVRFFIKRCGGDFMSCICTRGKYLHCVLYMFVKV